LGFLIHPFGVCDHGGSPASFAASQSKCALKRANLGDADPGVSVASFDPEEIRVVSDVAQQGPLFPCAIDGDVFPRGGFAAVEAILTGAGSLLTHQTTHEF
jgi:hypothetical protein